MTSQILKCQKCQLCNNQKPLLDTLKEADIMWVGLSAKQVDNIVSCIPLENNTNSGKIIELIENKNKQISFYKTNLVKCLPLNELKKLRYPNELEMNKCINNLLYEISTVKPKKIIVLGKRSYDFIIKYVHKNKLNISNIYYVEHPSYIYVYKRKYIDEYVNKVSLLCNEI